MMRKKLVSGFFYSKGAWLPVSGCMETIGKEEREPLLRKALD